MGVGVSCPKCKTAFAFCCNKCSSYSTEIYKGFEPEKYFQTRTVFYLKCKECQSEFDYALCPECHKKIFPTAPFVKGDLGVKNARGCFIATACLDENSLVLSHLYSFRDEFLKKHHWGRLFIMYYYRHSPKLAYRIRKNKLLKIFSQYLIVYPAYFVSRLALKIIRFHKKN